MEENLLGGEISETVSTKGLALGIGSIYGNDACLEGGTFKVQFSRIYAIESGLWRSRGTSMNRKLGSTRLNLHPC